MQAPRRLVALVFAALHLAVAAVPCPTLALAEGDSGEPPVMRQLCPCSCTAGPAVAVAGSYAAPPPRTELPALPSLEHDPAPERASLPTAPEDPLDHVPLAA